jgi:hypothetical protein
MAKEEDEIPEPILVEKIGEMAKENKAEDNIENQ